MLRSLVLALCLSAGVAAAEEIDLTASLSDAGLAATETRLAGDPPGPARDFALGGVRFLRAIEKSLQLRYRHNADFGAIGVPVLRLPVPPNAQADPFYPGLVTDLFRDVVRDMIAARESLPGATGEFGVTVDLAQVWFDIDGDGMRGAGEDLFAAASAAFGRAGPDGSLNALTLRFDAADAAWLAAYTHLLEGVGNLVLAFDPTEVIEEVLAGSAQMATLQGGVTPDRFSYIRSEEKLVDSFAIIYGALNRRPDAALTEAFRRNLLAMVDENRRFWALVAAETDNDREWIPGQGQVSALGITLPEDSGDRWLAVLDDAEAVLQGTRLVGHWRVEPDAGINVRRLLEDPVAVDIVTWVHGYGLLPYMERGELVSFDSFRRFERMFAGDALLFMVWFN